MTGTTGDLMGGDTLAGGGAAEAGDSLRSTVARHGQKIHPDKQKVRRMRTDLFHKDDVFIIACCGIRSGRYYARCMSLAPLPRKGLWSRRACCHIADGCKHYMSACKINQCCMMSYIPAIPARWRSILSIFCLRSYCAHHALISSILLPLVSPGSSGPSGSLL